jgi:hypothetical protein
MASAMAANGITMQYCSAMPRHFLQSSMYNNLTTIRVSRDRFSSTRWDSFLYASNLVSALGIWPWSDVFMSTETDNLLLSTLSAGTVGVGDPIGAESKANLFQTVRADGMIVKPDVPIVPIDAMYAQDAQAGSGSYYVVVPIGQSGISFLGDAGKFVSLGKKRITQVTDNGTVQATITFASGETSLTMQGYSPTTPIIAAGDGSVGSVNYNSASGLFSFAVSPGADGSATVTMAKT